MKHRLPACALLCLLFFIPAHAAGEFRTVEVESLSISIDSEWSTQIAPGYWPVRFNIANFGGDRVIEINGLGNRWWSIGASGSMEVHRTLHLKPGDRLRLTISVPVFGDNESLLFQIRENGRILQAFNYNGLQGNKSPEETAALIVADPSALRAMAASWPRPVPRTGISRGSTGSAPSLDFILDPPRLPTDWLGYTSLRAVFIGSKEWAQLDAVQKEALLTWTASGGDLMFLDGDLNALIPDRQSQPAAMTSGTKYQSPYYFGHIYFLKSDNVNSEGLAVTLAAARDSIKDPARTLPANRAPDWLLFSARGFRLPIPGVEGVPVRSYMTMLLIFSLLIGPVNYVLLRRKRRQVLLVLTAPLISLTFIVLLAAYALLGEGIGVKGTAESFTLLDQTTKHAAMRASVSLYAAGMTPWNGLRFPREMAIFPVGLDGKGSRDRESLDLTESQQFSSGIVRARAPSNFEEIAFRPARERLTFSRDGGNIAVVNGLGATVQQLFYRKGGEVYTLGAPLRAGERAAMRVGGKIDADALPWKYRRIAETQDDNTYLATLERSPFLETGVAGVEERGAFHLVLGYTGGEQ